jgi:hypothetical protein
VVALVTLIALVALVVLVALVILRKRQDRDQSSGYQREHLNNAIVKPGNGHPIPIPFIWAKPKNKHKTDLLVFTKIYGKVNSGRFQPDRTS